MTDKQETGMADIQTNKIKQKKRTVIKSLPSDVKSTKPANLNKGSSATAAAIKVPKTQCIASRSDKQKCTRIQTNDSELCYWHIKNLKYGLFTEIEKPSDVKSEKKTKVTTIKQSDINSDQIENKLNTSDSGSVDVPILTEPPKPKTRGRKRKQEIDKRFTDDAYITMWPEICEGTCVLVDRNDNVYTYNIEQPTYLGIKLLNGKIDKSASPRSNY